MTNAERLNFLSKEIDKLLSVKKQSRILLKKNDYEFAEKRGQIWLNKNPNGNPPTMEGFSFKVNDHRKIVGLIYKDIPVVDIESVKMGAT